MNDPASNIVVGPVNLGCSGVSNVSGIPWSGSTCGYDDLFGWKDEVNQWAVVGVEGPFYWEQRVWLERQSEPVASVMASHGD